MKKNNKGYTLVELMLTLLIFSVIMISIIMIMRTTIVSYKNGLTEASVQENAQIAINQISNILVDNVSEPLSARLRGESKPALPIPLDLIKDPEIEGIESEARQRKSNLSLLTVIHQRYRYIFEFRMIGCRKTEK